MVDVLVVISVFILGFIFIHRVKKKLRPVDGKYLRLLWLYHILFTVIFYYFTQNNPADANGYWRVAQDSTPIDFLFYLGLLPGTSSIYIINYIPAKVLGLSFFSGMMLYSLIGFIGLYYFYYLVIKLVKHNSTLFNIQLFPLLFFLPNLHFWSSAIGKDTLLFFAIGMFSYAIYKIEKRIHLLLFSIVLSYFIRPHIVILLLAAFSLAFLFSKRINKPKKILFSFLLFGASLYILPRVLEYVNISSLDAESIMSRSSTQAENLSGQGVGSSVNIASYPFPLKVLTFLYRPTFIDITGIPALLAAFENLLLLILSYKVLISKPIQTLRKSPLVIKGFLYFLFFGTLIFSFSLSNLGIIIRMKNMFLPGMLIYILWALSYKSELEMNEIPPSKEID